MNQFIIKSDFKINDYITLDQNKKSSCSLIQLGLSWCLGFKANCIIINLTEYFNL